MTNIDAQIAQLPDDHAMAALALVLERQGHPIDPFAAQATEAHLREALHQPDLPSATAAEPDATPGALARTALRHLAVEDEAVVARAIAIGPNATRFDPATLAIGALVLMAFHSDIELAHEPGQGWRFRFHAKPLSDSTIGKLLGQLFGVFGDTTP
jgi:hypothetical protein